MGHLDTAIDRLLQISRDDADRRAPFRALVTGTSGGMVTIRRPEAATGEDELRARVPGWKLSPGDEVLCIPVSGKPFVLGPVQRSTSVPQPPEFGTSVAADSVGAVVRKVEVYNAAGASLGFIAIHDDASSSPVFVEDRMSGYGSYTGDALTDHVGEVGATWAAHPSAAGEWSWFDERYYPTTPGIVTASGAPSSADYIVSCRYRYLSNTGAVGIAGRIQSGAATCYYAYHNSGQWVLAKLSAGTPTTINTSSQTLTAGNDYLVELSMVGSAISLAINGVTATSGTDSSITAAGSAGVRSAAAVTTTTGKHISHFRTRGA